MVLSVPLNLGIVGENDVDFKIEKPLTVESSLKGSNLECFLCKTIMKEIDNELREHEESIENTVRNICQRLPDTLKQDCAVFVKDYGDTVIQLLIQVLQPSDICPYLKLCNSVTEDPSSDPPNDDCYLCKRISWTMSKILANPKTQHDMAHVFEKTCRAMPLRSRKQCQELLHRKGKEIYTLLIHKADKRTICTKVGLCKDETKF